MDRTVEIHEVQPLLAIAGDDPNVDARLRALDALSRFPLVVDAWHIVSANLRREVFTLAPGSSSRRRALEIAVRVPLLSVREALRGMASDPDEPDREWISELLVEARDPSQAEDLISQVRAGDARAYEPLAAMPLESLGFSVDGIPEPSDDGEEDASFWYAVTVARLGEFEPLDLFLEGKKEEPKMFWSDPWRPYNRLAAVRPIPERMRDHLLALLKEHERQPWLDRLGQLVIWALTGVADAEGSPITPEPSSDEPPLQRKDAEGASAHEIELAVEAAERVLPELFGPHSYPAPEDFDQLASLPPERAGEFALAVLEEGNRRMTDLGPEASAMPMICNSILDVALRLDASAEWPVSELVSTHLEADPSALDDSQMAWLLARAPVDHVIGQLEPAISSERSIEERLPILRIVGLVGDHLAGRLGSPWRGAGAGGESAVGREPLIPDYKEESVAAAPPRNGGPTYDSMFRSVGDAEEEAVGEAEEAVDFEEAVREAAEATDFEEAPDSEEAVREAEEAADFEEAAEVEGARDAALEMEEAEPQSEETASRAVAEERETPKAPRVLNANFRDPNTGLVLTFDQSLVVDRDYDLLVDVGPISSKVPSIVTKGPQAEFPVEALPQDRTGYVVDAVLVCEAFTPSTVAGQFWVPRKGGQSIPYVEGQNLTEPGPIALRFRTPAVLDEPNMEPVRVSGRLCLYFENNLLQSAVVSATVTAVEARLQVPNELRVDFRLSSTFGDTTPDYARRDVRFFPGDDGGRSVALNITVNDDGAGNHRIIVKDKPGVPPAWMPYDPSAGENSLEKAREALLDCFWTRNPDGKVDRDGDGRPVQIGLDGNNGKTREQFGLDLFSLAKIGEKLYTSLFNVIDPEGSVTARSWDKALREQLTRGEVIQIARTASSPPQYVFPWALLYEYPLTVPDGELRWCDTIVQEWTAHGVRSGPPAAECPYREESWHQSDVLCPYGFWGLKHIVEQPLSVLEKLRDATNEIPVAGAVGLSIGTTQDTNLDLGALKTHFANLTASSQLQLVDPQPNPAADRNSVGAVLEDASFAYFLCHGEYDSDYGEPYLGVGPRDYQESHKVYPETVTGWARKGRLDEWSSHRPLVFINGCHTSDLKPGEVLNFVSTFATAGAGGVIGTEVSIRLPLAVDFAQRLVDKLLLPLPVGQALREVRWELANKGNLLGLAYTFYGLADLHFVSH